MDKEVEEVLQPRVTPLTAVNMEADLQFLSPLAQPPLFHESSSDRVQLPVSIHSIIAESTIDAGERGSRVRSGPLPVSVQPRSAHITRTAPPFGRKVLKHIGRFDVWRGRFDNGDDLDGESPSWHGSPRDNRKSDETRREREDRELRRGDDRDRKEEREQRRSDERSDRDELRRVRSATFGSERVLSSIRGFSTMDERERERERDRDRDHRQGGRSGEDSGRMMQRERSFNGPITPISDRSSVTQFGNGKDWGVGEKRSELGRFERYGVGNRDSLRADHDGSYKDSGFSHGWRRERSHAGGIARHSSFTGGNRNLGEHAIRGSLSVTSGHDSLYASSLASNQDYDQPSPSKRPRLGWGQGLAKYEKKVGDTDDVSPSVERFNAKKDGEGEIHPNVEEVEMIKVVEYEKRSVPGWVERLDTKKDGGDEIHSNVQEAEKKKVVEHDKRPVPWGIERFDVKKDCKGEIDSKLEEVDTKVLGHENCPMPGGIERVDTKRDGGDGIHSNVEEAEKKKVVEHEKRPLPGATERFDVRKNRNGEIDSTMEEVDQKKVVEHEKCPMTGDIERFDVKKDGSVETDSNMEDVEKLVEHEKRPVPGWEHELKREVVESFSDGHVKLEEDEKKPVLIREHGGLEGSGQDSNSCALVRDPPREEGEDEKKPALLEELQGLEESPASSTWMENYATTMNGGKNENTSAHPSDIEDLELNGQIPVLHCMAEDSEGRRGYDEVTFAVLQESESLEVKDQNLPPSVLLGEAEMMEEDNIECSALVKKSEEILGGSHQNAASLIEALPCPVDTMVVCPSSSQSLPTSFSTGLDNSISSGRGISSTPALCGRMDTDEEMLLAIESSATPMPEKEALKSLPGGILLEPMRVGKDKDAKVVLSGSMSLSLGSEESDCSGTQFGNEVATGGSSLQERNLSMVESLMMENKEKARMAGVPFVHLLPQNFTGDTYQQLYQSPTEAPVWQHNVETHKNIHDRLLKKLSERHHFYKFKERILTLRFRALKEAWNREQKGLSDRRNRPKPVSRWDSEGRCSHGPPSQRSSLRLRPLSLSRLDADSDAALAMKKLMKDPQVEALRPILKMPAMILDEKERAFRRFVSRNALVEDPVAVEMERKTLNPWTAEERKIFTEKFALHNKNFKEIALHLQYKTTADCIEYYYRNQKSEDFEKSQHGVQLKNRWDYTKTSSTFLTPTAAGIKRNHEANCARVEALNVANMHLKEPQINSHVLDHAKPISSSDPLSVPSNAETPKIHLKESKVLEVVLPSGAIVETATSSLISTPCSMSSTAAAAPLTDQCKEKGSVKERIGRGPSTTRNCHSEQHPAGLKGTRSTHLRRMSSRAAAQEQDSQWTDEERELFTSAVASYGKDFRLIASHVGSKSQNQCKAFFSKTRKRLGLDDLVEQFQANEAAAMLVQNFRHDADLVQEVKLISTAEMDATAGVIAHSVEELSDTAAAVSTLESLKEQSKCLANDMSDLSLVADAAAVMEEITLVKSECQTLDLFSSGKSLATSQDLVLELSKVHRSNFSVAPIVIRKEEEDDSEATKSDDSYQAGTEAESDIVVDQAAAALLGMSEMLADIAGLKRSKSEAKVGTRSSPVSVFSRSHSVRLPTASPPLPAVMEANLCLTSGRNSRQAKERINAAISCKPTTRDRPQDIQDAHTGRKGRETAGAEPKPRREPTSWTQEEKEKFADILQEHGKDWALLHENLPSKSLTQIKTYFQNSKARSRLPTSDKLVNVVRSDGVNRKRKAEDYESTRKAAELAVPVKQKVRSNVSPPEFDSSTQKDDTLLGSASVSGTAGVGVDILAYAARFGAYSGQPVDQDTLSVQNGMQHLVRQMVSANTYAQGSKQEGHQVFRPGARAAVPSPVVTHPHSAGGILQQLSGPGLSKAGGSDLQAHSPSVVPQAGPPAGIHQQVQQMLAQQQHLKKQLALLLQQQATLPQQLLPQHHEVTQQTLQAVRPLEEKLQQVVQQLQQQHDLQGRGLAQSQEAEVHSHMHFQHQQVPQARGILKVKPIRGAISKPLVDLAISPSSGVFQDQNNSRNPDNQLQQQDHSLSLGIGTIPTVTAGSTAELLENHAKTAELQDSDTDTDCEGMGSRQMVAEDSHQRMSVVHSTSSGQQQGAAQSTTSTLSSDSEQVKSWDVKLFGQSLLSKPPSLPSSVPRSAGSSMQEFVKPSTSSPAGTVTFPTGTLSKGFRSSESLPSAFGRVGASSIIAEGQPTSWASMSTLSGKLGQYGAWSTTSSLQLSGVTEPARKEIESESTLEAVTSMAADTDRQHSDAEVLVLASQHALQVDDEHRDSDSGLSAGQSETPVCDTGVEDSPFLDRSQSSCLNGHVASSEADQCQVGLNSTQLTSQMNSLPTVSAGNGQWG